jgi:hypothetical protein
MLVGGTPKHEFELPIHTSLLNDLLITYSQMGIIILEKRINDCSAEGNVVSLELSQEDTLKFDEHIAIEIQLKIKTLGGEVIPSDIIVDTPSRCLNKVVL